MRAGDKLRVSAQFLDAPAGTVQWSHRSEAKLDDLFALQDDLTRQIVDSLAVPLSRSDEQALKRDVPASARAYEFHLRTTCTCSAWTRTPDTHRLGRGSAASIDGFGIGAIRRGRPITLPRRTRRSGERSS